jgi:hypothetical protein
MKKTTTKDQINNSIAPTVRRTTTTTENWLGEQKLPLEQAKGHKKTPLAHEETRGRSTIGRREV